MAGEISKDDENNSIATPVQGTESDRAQADNERIEFRQDDDLSESTPTAYEPSISKSPEVTVIDGIKATNDHDSLDLDLDTRLPYRQGSPLLPTLPVRTSHKQVPKILSEDGAHFHKFHSILVKHKVSIQKLNIAHRFNTGTPVGKVTLTLCVQSDLSCSQTWESAIRSLHTYISEQALTLAIEIIDYRIFKGRFTLPILSYDPIASFLQKRKHSIIKALNDSGEEWTSLEFFYRGFGPTRNECKATVLIGVPEPNRRVWWENVLTTVREKVGRKVDVEICWRRAIKF